MNTSHEIIGNAPLSGTSITMFLPWGWYSFHSHFWYIFPCPVTDGRPNSGGPPTTLNAGQLLYPLDPVFARSFEISFLKPPRPYLAIGPIPFLMAIMRPMGALHSATSAPSGSRRTEVCQQPASTKLRQSVIQLDTVISVS
jgi:hypothetical protein